MKNRTKSLTLPTGFLKGTVRSYSQNYHHPVSIVLKGNPSKIRVGDLSKIPQQVDQTLNPKEVEHSDVEHGGQWWAASDFLGNAPLHNTLVWKTEGYRRRKLGPAQERSGIRTEVNKPVPRPGACLLTPQSPLVTSGIRARGTLTQDPSDDTLLCAEGEVRAPASSLRSESIRMSEGEWHISRPLLLASLGSPRRGSSGSQSVHRTPPPPRPPPTQ